MQVDIPDHLKPNVFLFRASGRPTCGLYTQDLIGAPMSVAKTLKIGTLKYK